VENGAGTGRIPKRILEIHILSLEVLGHLGFQRLLAEGPVIRRRRHCSLILADTSMFVRFRLVCPFGAALLLA